MASYLDFFRSKSNKLGKIIPETVIIIPCWNEEHYLGKTLDYIKETGLNVHVIVIDDGSTDKTVEVAKAKGVEVHSLPKNMGKTAAFFKGLKEAVRLDPEAIITLDADMITVGQKSLLELINLSATYSRLRKVQMFVANQHEEEFGNACPTNLVGIRAFSVPAAWKLLTSKFKSLPRRFALETFLTHYFYGSTTICKKAIFLTHEAYRKTGDFERQKAEIVAYQDALGLKARKARLFRNFKEPNSPLRARLK